MTRASLRRIFYYVLWAAIFWAVFSLGYGIGSWAMQIQYNTVWPNIPGCQLTTVARYPSDDGTNFATVLKRDCDMGDHINYFLRLDIGPRRAAPRGWFSFVELDNDRPERDPVVSWIKPRTIQATVSTRTLSGTLVENSGNVTVVRIYAPREPGAMPNWR